MLVEAWHHLLKGNFMQGKRNQRLDHLIYILVDQAIPYFIQRHHRQEVGFEGPDLEVQRRLKIEERGLSIPLAHITQDTDQGVFFVQSQSKPQVRYRVDLEAYDCDCIDFPAICFSKHICAVQCHFPEMEKLVPTSMLSIHCTDTVEPDVGSSDSDDEFLSPTADTSPKSIIDSLINKLSALAIQLQASPPPVSMSAKLEELYNHLGTVMDNLSASDNVVLSSKKKIGPNQHSWMETASVMNVRVKSKRKIHTDPYGGGERSGKKAKPDARSAPTTIITQTQPPVASQPFATSQPPVTSVCIPGALTSVSLDTQQLPSSVPDLNPGSITRASKSIAMAFSTDIPSLTSAAPSLHMLAGPSRAFNVIPMAVESSSGQTFCPVTFDLRNAFSLNMLKRPQLNQLCKHHGVAAGGTNEALITRLQSRIPFIYAP